MSVVINVGCGGGLERVIDLLEGIMASQAELAAQVNAIGAKLTKIGTETSHLITKVEELTALVAAQPAVSAELQAAVNALAEQADVVDQLVADAAPPTPP